MVNSGGGRSRRYNSTRALLQLLMSGRWLLLLARLVARRPRKSSPVDDASGIFVTIQQHRASTHMATTSYLFPWPSLHGRGGEV